MSGKPRKAREPYASKLPQDIFPPRFRAPREVRVVSATTVRKKSLGKSGGGRRFAPQIRLSGQWLARIGFKRGTRFLVLADVQNQIVLALLDA